MLYGNLIFIKKTGGDGSKYPVTEKNIKIGRSENCLIRIYNPQVAPEHCQLIIDYNGQAKLRNLFTPIILNGKPLDQGDVTLCHGDVFKLGERLARWEYLPTSKYFQQQISPTGRLIAVVNPQRRSELPGTSATQSLVSNNTPVGSKRKFSDKFVTESFSVAKQRKTIGPSTSVKPKIDLGKYQIRRHSIKNGKMLLKIPTIKNRKSMPGIISSKTLQGKISENSRKSTLPSWKVSDDAQSQSQSEQSTQSKRSPFGGAVKTPLKRSLKNEVRTPSKSTPIKVKTPKRLRLDSKAGDKTQLHTIMESPPKLESVRSTRSLGKSPGKVISTPQRKQSIQAVRLVQSEKKAKSGHGVSKPSKGFRKMSLVLNRVDGNRIINLPQKINNPGRKSAKGKIFSSKDDVEVEMLSSRNLAGRRKSSAKNTSEKGDPSLSSPNQARRESLKIASKTLRKSNKPVNQSPIEKVAKGVAQTPPLIYFSDESDSVNTKRTSRVSVTSGQRSLGKSVRKSSAHPLDTFQTPQKFSKKAATSGIKKTREEGTVSSVSTPSRSRKSGSVASTKVVSSSKEKASPRGVRRKLNLSISSAERAAKKLKTSSPKKPDKNKRAALLVLGKANRKQQLSQNVKVLLKQKIVKKAIKQSVALPLRKVEEKKTAAKKIKKALQKKKKPSKVNHTANISTPARVSLAAKEPPASNKSTEKSINVLESSTPNVKKGRERSSLSRSKINSPVPLAKIATPNSGSVKSPAKSGKRTEATESTNQTISPFVKFDKSSESYIFSSNRRCSKRLSSKNDTERPDFVELSPTALGLIPKNIEIFKTPKEKKRKSSSLVTPRNIRTTGIIKAASTSKIGNRKSVSFSSKDLTMNAFTPNINENTDFDFDSFHTSNITTDVFVSPLNKSGATPVADFVTDENMKPSEKRLSPGSKKVVRKLLLSPQKEPVNKRSKLSDQTNTTRNNMSDSKGVRKPGVSPRGRKSPRNDLTDVRGVRRLLATPKSVKSPKNDLTDVRGVKNLFGTRKVQRSPKNDLSDVKGVKKLMQTPKVHKSPKNDLSDLKGVKKLMRTPKQQKSPKNELIDLRGVKRLLQSPRNQKSPKNELTDLRGVKKLLQSPRNQKSPKNDLTDVTGVKRLLRTPKVQKSPKNDLTNVTGVKRLMKTPKVQKSPKNSLTDLEGVQELFISPEPQKNSVASSRRGRAVNKINKGPKNDLSDVCGVRELFARHKSVSDHDVSLTGVAELFDMSAAEEVVVEKGGSEPKRKKSLDVRETKTLRGRPRKLGSEKKPQVRTRKLRAKIEGSTEVKTRLTRSRKQDPNSNVGEEINKPPETGGRKATRAKKAETVKKLTRTKVESKSEKKASKAEPPKTQRKRKPVDAVDSSPPKLRRKAAAVTSKKGNSLESKTAGIASKTKTTEKAKEKVEAKSLKKVAGKLKTATKKVSKVQIKTTKSGTTSVSKTQKVQKRSQADSKLESSKSGSNISPRKTRSVSTKSSSQKARNTGAGRKK